ncbi:MAG TPA: hypothetical protein VJ306_02250 [Pyrinomonadaceae bacterium]|jgi:hypothetical protein|nr:hypothetical protein [Pyrinomonadaceae bacterium]
MKTTKLTGMAMALMFACLSFVTTARADGARSYISPSGSDNRPCTRNQPCRTFDAAIAKTDAGGEIVAMETGTYDPTTIAKSITLTAAPGADVAIRANSGNAVTITANAGDIVVLRGLRIGGPGKNATGTAGVFFNINSPSCCVALHIEHSIISDFERGVQMELGVASRLIVSDSVFRANKTGINMFVGGADGNGASIDRSRFESNEVGLRHFGGNSAAVSNSIASGNGIGFQTEGSGKLELFYTVASKNGTGVKADGGIIRVAYSTATGNGHGWSLSGGTIASMGNNMVLNNDVDISGAINLVTFLPR